LSSILPKIGSKRLADIRRPDIFEIMAPHFEQDRLGTARNIFRAASAFLTWCADHGYADFNPLLGWHFYYQFEIGTRRPARCLDRIEVVDLWNSCEKLREPWCSAIRLMIASGQRKSVVLNASWSDFDSALTTWQLRLPHDGDKDITVNELSRDILLALPHNDESFASYKGKTLVFPSPMLPRNAQSNSVRNPIRAIGYHVRELRRISSVKDWRLGDFRFTVLKHVKHARKTGTTYHDDDLVLWGDTLKNWIAMPVKKPEEVVL
jgi:integrase